MNSGPENFFAAPWPLGAVKTTAKYQHHIQRDTCRLHGCLSLASRHGPVPTCFAPRARFARFARFSLRPAKTAGLRCETDRFDPYRP